MRPTWKIGEGSLETRYADRKLERVLVEYDGPQLVLLRENEHRYLGLASDADERHIRWIHARISDLEWASLAHGLITVRDVLQKPTIWIVDEYADGDGNNRGQEADGADLVDDDLPSSGTLLPTVLRTELARETPQTERRALRLERRDRAPLDLGGMGLASRKYQAFWTSCGLAANKQATAAERSGIAKRAQLVPVATFPGSLGLRIEIVDNDLFNTIASMVARLVSYSGDHEAMASFFVEFPGVRAAYDSLLATLSDERIDILASWSNIESSSGAIGGVFLGSERAPTVRTAIKATATSEEVTFPARGHFRGFSKGSKRFEFFDPDAATTYTGEIAKSLIARAREASVIISEADLYDVTIAEKTTGDDERAEYELRDFSSPILGELLSSTKS